MFLNNKNFDQLIQALDLETHFNLYDNGVMISLYQTQATLTSCG